MNTVHTFLGFAVVASFLVLMLWGLIAKIARRPEVGTGFWRILIYTENVLALQILVGIVLLIIGRRVGDPLHYVYGAVFPIMVDVVGRIASLRRETQDYVPIAVASFFAFGLTTRALMTGLGIG